MLVQKSKITASLLIKIQAEKLKVSHLKQSSNSAKKTKILGLDFDIEEEIVGTRIKSK